MNSNQPKNSEVANLTENTQRPNKKGVNIWQHSLLIFFYRFQPIWSNCQVDIQTPTICNLKDQDLLLLKTTISKMHQTRSPQVHHHNSKVLTQQTTQHLQRLHSTSLANNRNQSSRKESSAQMVRRETSTTHQAKSWDILPSSPITIASMATLVSSTTSSRSIRLKCASTSSTREIAHLLNTANLLMAQKSWDSQMM